MSAKRKPAAKARKPAAKRTRKASAPVVNARGLAMLHKARLALRAAYDAAQTNDENKNHWVNVDSLSAASANSPDVRKKLRERARYEVSNNSYAKGIVLTLANNLVGPGPRLQVTTADDQLNRAIESAFAAWAKATRFADQLRTMKQAKTVDGEIFGIWRYNPRLPTSVKLDLELLETDQVATPDRTFRLDPYMVDGIKFDEYRNPIEYHVLRSHPGDAMRGFYGEYDRLSARNVLHWFRCDRPGQARGIPELTPALPLLPMLRRFTLATLTAAEFAASVTGIIKSTMQGDTGDAAEPEAMDAVNYVRGMLMTLPDGYDISQLKAEHPTSSMEMFVKLVLREIARCLNIPWNIAAGDSSSFNFSSARLDHLVYRDAVAVERQDCEREVLEPTFDVWLQEALLIPGLLPPSARAYLSGLPHIWHWPAWSIMDPTSEASANTERMNNGTATLAQVAAENGQDWQEIIRQQVKEKAFRLKLEKEAGIPQEGEAAPAPPPAPPAEAIAASGSLAACGGKGGKPGPCPTGGGAKTSGGGKKAAKPANVKVKAAEAKVQKINAKVTAAKAKLDTLKGDLKAAKVDLKAAKDGAKTKVAANAKTRAEIKPEVISKTADIFERAGKRDAVSFGEIDQHLAGMKSLRQSEIVQVANKVDIFMPPKTPKKKALEMLSQAIKGRKENIERTGRAYG